MVVDETSNQSVQVSRAQNKKMQGSPIVMCPEVEQDYACVYFGKGMCRNCYAESLWPKRKQGWKGRSKTPSSGIVRLGTWREILKVDYDKFKGIFPNRTFFMISRGLQPIEFYRSVQDDPRCLNIQISIDIDESGKIIPDLERIKELLVLRKVILRYKTQKYNIMKFITLTEENKIPRQRILETPLRLGKYDDPKPNDVTLLERIWDRDTFYRCNTKCADCLNENGKNVCCSVPI